MSRFFSFKLYIEGIKKSRLQGITIGAIVTALTALIPLIQLLTVRDYPSIDYTPSTTVISPSEFAIPLLLLLFLTPILTLNMFSYLNKRSESDFYHSIPFTRPCTYFSFLAAVLTWLIATLVVSLSLTTLLWSFVPYTAFAAATPLLIFGAYFLACLLLTAFTMLAMTLTGTFISNLLIFALLFGFVRITGALFVYCLEGQYPMLVTALTPGRLLLPEFNLPISLLTSIISFKGATAYENASLWIYTAIVSVLLIAVGCIVYTKRRSEMAGRSAPNRILQHVYRCAITLPMAFVIAYYIIEEGLDVDTLLILIVLTLIIYYLYEILTTKRLKNCLKATLFLPVLVVGGLIFGGGVTIASNAAANYAPDADELKSVSIYQDSTQRYGITYGDLKTQTIEITDSETLQFVAEKLAEMKDTVSKKGTSAYLYPFNYNYDDKVNYADKITLKITEKSGRVCGRTFRLTVEDYNQLITHFTESKEYEEALLSIPTEEEVLNLWVCGCNMENETVWRCFTSEYNALSREQKIAYQNLYSNDMFTLEVWGAVGVQSFNESYQLTPEYVPQTCKLVMEIARQDSQDIYQTILSAIRADQAPPLYISLYVEEYSYPITGNSIKYLETLEFAENCQTAVDKDAVLFYLALDCNGYYCERYYMLSQEDFNTLCGMLGVSPNRLNQ